jgi:hypothetical protein
MRGGAKLGVALGPTELQGDPLFVDASSGDLRLGAGSPAIDKGEITIFASDIRGAAVPQGSAPDIGAYESSP